jgi:mono/diheme cytochrome c family protein
LYFYFEVILPVVIPVKRIFMMVRQYIAGLFFSWVLLAACAVNKNTEYNLPPYITEAEKENVLATLEKGRKLYQLHCSECHGIFTKGKDGIPNFTDKQIDNYTAWAIKRDPKNHAVVANMNPAQLQEVFTFLRYRKRKGGPAEMVSTKQEPVNRPRN